MADPVDHNEERQCRYCLSTAPAEDMSEEDGRMLAPCGCGGGQRWVHLGCLRRWQRTVLASQPAPWLPEAGLDIRAMRCNICLQQFSVVPPSRIEVLQDGVGKALAEMLLPGYFVTTSPRLSDEFEEALQAAQTTRSIYNFVHWCRGAYLLYRIAPRQIVLAVPDQSSWAAAMELVDAEGLLQLHGRRYRLLPKEFGLALRTTAPQPPQSNRAEAVETAAAAAAPVSERPEEACCPDGYDGHDVHDVAAALAKAKGRLPARLRLEAEVQDFAEDTLLSVNLARTINEQDLGDAARRELARSLAGEDRDLTSLQPRLRHFLGGPMDQSRCCLVLWSSGEYSGPRWWPHGSQPLTAQGLVVCGCLSEAMAAAISVNRSYANEEPIASKRIRLMSTEQDQQAPTDSMGGLRPSFLSGADPEAAAPAEAAPLLEALPEVPSLRARVVDELMLFWGEARWSRTQLLSEIAKGDWGLSACEAGDLESLAPGRVWHRIVCPGSVGPGAPSGPGRAMYAPGAVDGLDRSATAPVEASEAQAEGPTG